MPRKLTARVRCADCGAYHAERREERRIEAQRVAIERIHSRYTRRHEEN